MNEQIGTASQEAMQRNERMPSREKYWEEMELERKIEALRDALAHACRIISTQEVVLAKMLEHSHDANGKLVAPFHSIANHALGSPGYGAFTADGGIPFNLRTKHERR